MSIRSELVGINKELAILSGIILIAFIGYAFLEALKNIDPKNSVMQGVITNFEVIFRVLIEWNTPDPTLWIIRILFILTVGAIGYVKLNNNQASPYL